MNTTATVGNPVPSSLHELQERFIRRLSLPIPDVIANRVLGTTELQKVWDGAFKKRGSQPFFGRLLAELGVEVRYRIEDLRCVRSSGRVILIANHPFGLLDGLIVGKVLESIRSDFRFLANSVIREVPELRDYVIALDPFSNGKRSLSNVTGLRAAFRWLESGHALVIFPAGEVSSFSLKSLQVTEPAWNSQIIRLAKRTGTPIVPLFIPGSNSFFFHAIGIVSATVRSLLLGRELLGKRDTSATVFIGQPLSPPRLAELSDSSATQYIQTRITVLSKRSTNQSYLTSQPKIEIALSRDPKLFPREIGLLPADQELASSGNFSAYVASADQIPGILREIGRLREISFRAVGEGTGGSVDLDQFDAYYKHLVIWDRHDCQIVGAYRFAETDHILPSLGPSGLYSTTLYQFPSVWLESVSPAIELGRSFVRLEYQRKYQPLFLLWKAIGAHVARNPRYRYLFGSVSISGKYSTNSRQLIHSFFRPEEHTSESVILPGNPFRSTPRERSFWKKVAAGLRDVEQLNDLVSDLEHDRTGLPVLLRQYCALGGKILAFNLDPSFSNVLDGLILVDLMQTDPRILLRYFGSDGVEAFRRHHDKKILPGWNLEPLRNSNCRELANR